MKTERFLLQMMALMAAWFLSGTIASSQVLPPGMSAKKDGILQVADLTLGVVHYDGQWYRGKMQVDPGYANLHNITDADWQYVSTIQTHPGISLKIENKIARQPEGKTIRWTLGARAEKAVSTKTLSLNLEIPIESYAGKVLSVDGKTIELPREMVQGKPLVWNHPGSVRRLEIPTAEGPVTLAFDHGFIIQDNRQWNGKTYTLRMLFSPYQGEVSASELTVTIGLPGYHSQMVDLRPVANMGFADEKDGDARGGWTDQGAGNDLSMLKPGAYRFGGLDFQVIDPARNGGKSCLMFSASVRPYFMSQASLSVVPGQYRRLYLLHSSAWTPKEEAETGRIVAKYADGSSQTIPVMSRRDLGDWWNAYHRPNGVVVWSAPNGSSYVGLYLSQYALQDKPLQAIELQSVQRGVWGVLAMTLSRDDVPLPGVQKTTRYIVADPDWQPIRVVQDVLSGSILDLSDLQPSGPAGRHGRTRVVAGRLEFEGQPGQPVRFYGPNLCFDACYQTHEESDKLATRLRAMGYNIVRLHAFDGKLQKKDAKTNEDFDEEQWDRLQYLIHAMKRQGIYLTMDLYIGRRFFAHESELNEPFGREIKSLLMVDPQAMKAWQAFAHKLLTGTNPYTGMALAQDPALVSISPVNEEFILHKWNEYPKVAPMYIRSYEAWLAKQKLAVQEHPTGSPTFMRFLVEGSRAMHQQMQQYLRGLGFRGLFSGDNADLMMASSLLRDSFDYVDNHFYHDHPGFGGAGSWSMPYVFHAQSSVKGQGTSLRLMFPTRTLDKPFAVTEYNYCIPNPYRGESGPLVGAYASLQDWNILNRFDWAHATERLTATAIASRFEVANDPINRLAEQITAYFYVRRDVAPATYQVGYWVSPSTVYRAGSDRAAHPLPITQLGLVTGVGTVTPASLSQSSARIDAIIADASARDALAGKPWLDASGDYLQAAVDRGILPPGLIDLYAKRFTSETKQIELNASAGTFRVVTPKSEAVVLAQAGSHQADRLKVIDSTTHGTFFIACKDDLPLARSKRMVFFHLTDVLNTQMKFEDQDRRALADWGKLPHLVLKGQAKIELRLPQPQEIQVWQVDLSGKRVALLECPVKEDRLVIPVSTVSPKGNTLVYELVRP